MIMIRIKNAVIQVVVDHSGRFIRKEWLEKPEFLSDSHVKKLRKSIVSKDRISVKVRCNIATSPGRGYEDVSQYAM